MYNYDVMVSESHTQKKSEMHGLLYKNICDRILENSSKSYIFI